MLGRKGYDVKSKLFAQGIKDQTAGRSFSGENDGTGLKNGKGTDPSLLRAEYQSQKGVLFGLTEENGEQSRAVQNKALRQKSPLSS